VAAGFFSAVPWSRPTTPETTPSTADGVFSGRDSAVLFACTVVPWYV
jgi:hypothetical protein